MLVADDSLTIQKVIRLALSNEGYDIQAVSDGNEALQQIAVFRPDVVLIDISLPGKSAFEIKKNFNEQPEPKKTRFILMSSAFEKVDETQAGELGFQGRLTKPFDPAHLRSILAQALSAVISSEETERVVLSESYPSAAASEIQDLTPPPLNSSLSFNSDPSLPDDLAWSVTEPTLKPHPGLLDDGDVHFPLNEFTSSNIPTPPVSREKSKRTAAAAQEAAATPSPRAESPLVKRKTEAPAGANSAVQNIDALVKEQVESALLKMAQTMLPEIAERVIKQEIHRLLAEQENGDP